MAEPPCSCDPCRAMSLWVTTMRSRLETTCSARSQRHLFTRDVLLKVARLMTVCGGANSREEEMFEVESVVEHLDPNLAQFAAHRSGPFIVACFKYAPLTSHL